VRSEEIQAAAAYAATRRCDILDVHVFPERIDKQAFSE
jgi:hypothetical protein